MPGRILLAALVVAALTGPEVAPVPEPPVHTRYPPGAWPISARFGAFTGIAGLALEAPNPGIDIIARVRTPVHAAAYGVVALVAAEPDRGRVVEILTTGTEPPYRLVYAHLHGVSVEQGQPVRPGAEIGQVGDTGTVPRGIAHLRFELRLKEGTPVDPEPFLRSRATGRTAGSIECPDPARAARHADAGGYPLDHFALGLAGQGPGAPLVYPVGCVRG